MFPNLKKSLAGQIFESNEEVIAVTEAYFADIQKTYFSDGLKKLEHRWVKCIEIKGEYVEKEIATFPTFSFFFCRLIFIGPPSYVTICETQIPSVIVSVLIEKNCSKLPHP